MTLITGVRYSENPQCLFITHERQIAELAGFKSKGIQYQTLLMHNLGFSHFFIKFLWLLCYLSAINAIITSWKKNWRLCHVMTWRFDVDRNKYSDHIPGKRHVYYSFYLLSMNIKNVGQGSTNNVNNSISTTHKYPLK